MKYLALGSRIQKLREKKNLSIDELSKKTGLSVEKLIRIEEDKEQPIIGNLILLSKALGVNVADIFRDRFSDKAYEILKKGERQKVKPLLKPTKAHLFDYTYELLTHPGPDKHLSAYLIELPPRQGRRPSEDVTHSGEEFMYVLEGEFVGEIGGKKITLKEGDSIYFRSTESHVFFNPNDQIARAIAVIYPF